MSDDRLTNAEIEQIFDGPAPPEASPILYGNRHLGKSIAEIRAELKRIARQLKNPS